MEVLQVRHSSDRVWCARKAMDFARGLGFSDEDSWRIGIAVSELAANIARHAGAGKLTLRALDGPRRGLEVLAENLAAGGGNASPQKEAPGLGSGLEVIREVMDSCSVDRMPEGQFTVLARKHLQT
jgi:anti-sigma regulatory factor (Ser/Thr protein kinase)